MFSFLIELRCKISEAEFYHDPRVAKYIRIGFRSTALHHWNITIRHWRPDSPRGYPDSLYHGGNTITIPYVRETAFVVFDRRDSLGRIFADVAATLETFRAANERTARTSYPSAFVRTIIWAGDLWNV